MIRAMVPDDIESVADLAQSTRIRQQGWEPQYWAMAPAGRSLHPLFLGHQLTNGCVGLVDEHDGILRGAIITSDLEGIRRGAGGPVWVADDFHVAGPDDWTDIGRALLAGLAGRAKSDGIREILVPAPNADRAMSAMLGDARLELGSWFRHKALRPRSAQPPAGVRAYVEADEAETSALVRAVPRHRHALPSPPRFNGAGHLRASGLVLDDGDGVCGVSLVTASLPAPPVYDPGGMLCVAEPLTIDADHGWETEGLRLIEGVEWFAASRGDVAVVVPCGPDEWTKDDQLNRLGYGRPVDWWSWRC